MLIRHALIIEPPVSVPSKKWFLWLLMLKLSSGFHNWADLYLAVSLFVNHALFSALLQKFVKISLHTQYKKLYSLAVVAKWQSKQETADWYYLFQHQRAFPWSSSHKQPTICRSPLAILSFSLNKQKSFYFIPKSQTGVAAPQSWLWVRDRPMRVFHITLVVAPPHFY